MTVCCFLFLIEIIVQSLGKDGQLGEFSKAREGLRCPPRILCCDATFLKPSVSAVFVDIPTFLTQPPEYLLESSFHSHDCWVQITSLLYMIRPVVPKIRESLVAKREGSTD